MDKSGDATYPVILWGQHILNERRCKKDWSSLCQQQVSCTPCLRKTIEVKDRFSKKLVFSGQK